MLAEGPPGIFRARLLFRGFFWLEIIAEKPGKRMQARRIAGVLRATSGSQDDSS